MWGGTVWAITLWTRNRQPRLVGAAGPSPDATTPWAMAMAEWHRMGRDAPGLVLGEFVVLPDRLRALLYLAERGSDEAVAGALGSFMTRSSARVGLPGVGLWDPKMECVRIESPLELAVWQQRIRSTRDVRSEAGQLVGPSAVGIADG